MSRRATDGAHLLPTQGRSSWLIAAPVLLVGLAGLPRPAEAQARGLWLRLEPRPEWPAVRADRRALLQILINLLGNAVKFTQKGSVTLTLMRDAASGRLSAEVQDTGPGIESSDLVHVFEAFRQVGGAASRPFEGTGLGLTIARALAEKQGGTIRVASREGEGATFTLTIPLA